MSAASQMARAILKARGDLPPDLQRLLTPEMAWTLGILLASWRREGGGGELINLSGYGDVTGAFDRYDDSLLRFRRAAVSAAGDAMKIAAAGGYFVAAVKRIGTEILGYAIGSSRFAQLQRQALAQYPLPAELRSDSSRPQASASLDSRARRYLNFETRGARSLDDDDEDDEAPPNEDVAKWRADLADPGLAPEMRWLLEQKLLAANLPAYESQAQAHAMWSAAAQSSRNPNLRDYFADNLKRTEDA